jgi:hypothetical protein
VIAEEIVEASWREVAELSDRRALTYMDQLARKQREILTFVTTMTEHLSPAAQEIAIYAFVVIYRMFERAGPRLAKARRGRIIAAYEKIDGELGRLIQADERFLERHALVSTGREPFVMRYVSEVLLEPDDDEVQLSDDEVGEIFICLQTVVDVLHDLSESA